MMPRLFTHLLPTAGFLVAALATTAYTREEATEKMQQVQIDTEQRRMPDGDITALRLYQSYLRWVTSANVKDALDTMDVNSSGDKAARFAR